MATNLPAVWVPQMRREPFCLSHRSAFVTSTRWQVPTSAGMKRKYYRCSCMTPFVRLHVKPWNLRDATASIGAPAYVPSSDTISLLARMCSDIILQHSLRNPSDHVRGVSQAALTWTLSGKLFDDFSCNPSSRYPRFSDVFPSQKRLLRNSGPKLWDALITRLSGWQAFTR